MIKTIFTRNLLVQLTKFLTIGMLNTLIGLVVFYLLRLLNTHYSLALGLSYIAGIINSYAWNRQWTFNSEGIVSHEILRFASVYLTSYLINLLFMFILVEYVGINAEISVVISLIITTMISFIGHKLWSFRKPNKP